MLAGAWIKKKIDAEMFPLQWEIRLSPEFKSWSQNFRCFKKVGYSQFEQMIWRRAEHPPFKVNAKAAIRWEKATLNKVELKGMMDMLMIIDNAYGYFENQDIVLVIPGCSIQTEEKYHSCLLSGSSPGFLYQWSFTLLMVLTVDSDGIDCVDYNNKKSVFNTACRKSINSASWFS